MWTAEAVEYLRANWRRQSAAVIAAKIGRTRDGVVGKAFRLRLPTKSAARKWTAERHARVRARERKPGKIVQSRLYWLWAMMKRRCHSQKCKDFHYYGARGISVCSEWRNSFTSFQRWALESGYIERAGLSLDRINNDGNYEPTNCRWATAVEQARNKRRGRKRGANPNSLHAIAAANGINYNTLHSRLYRLNWSMERALQPPLARYSKHSRKHGGTA